MYSNRRKNSKYIVLKPDCVITRYGRNGRWFVGKEEGENLVIDPSGLCLSRSI
ncbi:MAG: hypothetical protein KKA35_08490 [Proteobacteria bacterium]|nr:hypothetical protein [Pseudomonadota bacterium]